MVRQAQDERDDSDFAIVLEELRSRIVVLFAAAPATLFCGVAGVVRLGQFERELEGTTYRPCLRVYVEMFGKSKEEWFRSFLDLPNGIPSHDTFGDVFSRLDPDRFQECFMEWSQAVADLLPGEVVERSQVEALIDRDYSKQGRINLMNYHQTKGREADTVVHLFRTDDYFGKEKEPYEETSRLLYVAISRGKQQVVIILPSSPHPLVELFLALRDYQAK